MICLTNNHFVTLGHQTHYPDSKSHSLFFFFLQLSALRGKAVHTKIKFICLTRPRFEPEAITLQKPLHR